MQKLPGDPLGFESAKRAAEKGTQFAKEQIEKHKKDIDYDSPPRDYIDAYLIKMREEEHRPDTPFTGWLYIKFPLLKWLIQQREIW